MDGQMQTAIGRVTSVSRNRLRKNALGQPVLNSGFWLERQRPEPEKKTSRETLRTEETPKGCECSCGSDKPFHKLDAFMMMWENRVFSAVSRVVFEVHPQCTSQPLL